ncbi:MAG: FkbM family methyltransferase, partial [Pseudomonadota bacterium]
MSNKNTAASLKGINVPASPFMNPTRISRINEGRYEHEEIEGALSVVNESDRILELGAGIGLVGAICAANAKPERILSYEANPSLLPFINELYEMNGVDDRIEVRNQLVVAGPDRPETMTFHVHRSFLGSSLTPARPSATHPVEIPTVSFEAVREEISPTIIVC